MRQITVTRHISKTWECLGDSVLSHFTRRWQWPPSAWLVEEASKKQGGKLVSGTSLLANVIAFHPDVAKRVLTGHGPQSNTVVIWFCCWFGGIIWKCLPLSWRNFWICFPYSNEFYTQTHKIVLASIFLLFLEGGKGGFPPFQGFSVPAMCQNHLGSFPNFIFLDTIPGDTSSAEWKHSWLRSRANCRPGVKHQRALGQWVCQPWTQTIAGGEQESAEH